MGAVWDWYWTPMGFVKDLFGICMGSVWDLHWAPNGICIGIALDLC